MSIKQWYETLFDNYGKQYDKEVFTQGTSGECDFIESELMFNNNIKIIDVGCGTGRHTIELTKRGYQVTGIDLSAAQIERAKEKATQEGLNIEFLIRDARHLDFNGVFSAAIMLCEGGFPLMETDEKNYEILQSVAKALSPGSIFIFTTLNGLFPLFHNINEFHEATNPKQEGARYVSETFDLMTFRDINTTYFTDDNGVKHELVCNERYYTPSEITWLLKSLGFTSIEIFGAVIGAYSREHKLQTKDFEMLVIARK
ncbi:MAG TPA: class I SAM-dependent methyltransferase [Saprospiraceae bacterium]|nr:class I SAM-dependent methyltransferase [Saprospiraceae bacterium]